MASCFPFPCDTTIVATKRSLQAKHDRGSRSLKPSTGVPLFHLNLPASVKFGCMYEPSASMPVCGAVWAQRSYAQTTETLRPGLNPARALVILRSYAIFGELEPIIQLIRGVDLPRFFCFSREASGI